MVQSISRVLDVLETLAAAEAELSLSELQSRLDLPLPTLHRLLKALAERGYVEQSGDTRRYGPGLKILEVADAAKRNVRFDLARLVRPFLQRLTDASGESSNFVIRHDRSIVCVEQVSSLRSVRMFTEVGHRAPLYCTGAGKAILSTLPESQLDELIATIDIERLTPHTLASEGDLVRDVAQARQRGFAVDNEEFELGVRCVAAPIFDMSQRCVGAVSISGPTTRMSSERAAELGPDVCRMSALCSTRLGHSPRPATD